MVLAAQKYVRDVVVSWKHTATINLTIQCMVSALTVASVMRLLRDLPVLVRSTKEEVYEQIDKVFHSCATVSVKEHHSGFPAVTVDCGETHIITDCLSLEEWWAKRKEGKE